MPGMEKDQNFHMRASVATLAALDRLRKKEADLPSRAEMIRRLIERASGK
jgi:hypothetical protein